MPQDFSKPRTIRWYFWFSVAVLAADIYVIGWPIYKGQVLHRFDYDPSAAPTWLDHTESVLAALLLPALFGLGAAFVKRASSGRTFFATAVLIGAVSVWCGYNLATFSHIDCGDDCVPAVPSYTALRWIAFVAAIPAILAPAVLAVVSSVSARRMKSV
jgi:hypothetical protein